MTCPMCDSSEHTLLGYTGLCAWLRCRLCGFDWNVDVRDYAHEVSE